MSALAQRQLSYFDGLEEASLYHEADSRGFVAVCTQNPIDGFNQRCMKVTKLAEHLAGLYSLPQDDFSVWLSQASFAKFGSRCAVDLMRIGLCFVDLDTYKVPTAKDLSRAQVIEQIHAICRGAGIPSPSLIVYSGNGYQVKWILDAYLPRAALVRWRLVEKRLVELFSELGADPAATDPSRIFRTVGSINPKTGNLVEVAYFKGKSLDTTTGCSFEALAALLPVERAEIEKKRKDRAKRADLKLVEKPDYKSTRKGARCKPSYMELAWARLEDLRLLAQLRGGINPGMRNTYMLLVTCQLALSGLVHPDNFTKNVRSLQEDISKDAKWLSDRDLLKSLEKRVQQHYQSHNISFDGIAGKQKTPIYTYRNSTMIRLLEITDAEQRQLKTIISKELATERDTLRTRAKRRASGVAERAEYLTTRTEAAQERREAILALYSEGKKPMQIMAELSVSRAVVTRALASK